jgi:hypothetical protein
MDTYNLFLDDIRHPYDCIIYMSSPGIYSKYDWETVRNHDEFVAFITKNGLPDLISFDHDLSDIDYYPEWLKIVNFDDYSISSDGRVRRDVISRGTSGGELKISHNKKTGTCQVQLTKNGVHYHKSVHRLVAEAYIPNPDNKPEVNHKDGNRSNNFVTNLEWNTGSENIKHSHDNLVRNFTAYGTNHTNSKSVTQYSLDGFILDVYGSTAEAERHLGIPYTNIAKCARGDRNSAGGFIWKYEGKLATVGEKIKHLERSEYVHNPPEREKTGMDCAKWLVDYCMDNKKELPDFVVHSMNPAGAENIKQLLTQFKEFQHKNQ